MDDLLSVKKIGVDTESDSLFVYKEKVCLIQISTDTNDYLIDPLNIEDLSPLGVVFENPNIEKIFHAAEYDLICLKRDFNFQINNVFDTMIASRILGKKLIGLSNLLESYFHVKADKRFQRANWGKRPLTEEMLHYARQDSHYLINLRNLLNEELVKENKTQLAQEDFYRISLVKPGNDEKNNDHCFRILKGTYISSQKNVLLIDICQYREKIAEKIDRPPFKIFGNQIIYQIVMDEPKSMDDLASIKGFSPKLISRYGKDILKIVEEAKFKEPYNRNHKPKPSFEYLNIIDNLKHWRKEIADDFSVESDVILPKDIIERIAKQRPATIEEMQKTMDDVPYRFKLYGEKILKLIN